MFQLSYKIPLKRALLWIFFTTFAISGIAWIFGLYNLHLRKLRLEDDQYRIIAIVQTNSQKESLKTIYLAELLDLSLDNPTNLYAFDVQEGEKKLLASPLIKEATIKKIRPGTLYVDYQMRVPSAYIGDYTNTAVDEEGYLFPFSPFFTPKNLPVLYLGLDKLDTIWGQNIAHDEKWQLALKVLTQLRLMKDGPKQIKEIDVSKAFSDSYGQRQIVVTLEEGVPLSKTIYLRLSTEGYVQGLVRYQIIKANQVISKGVVIDLRIPQLAFIKQEA